MSKSLADLISRTDCHLQVDYNSHKVNYESTERALAELDREDLSWRDDIVGCTAEEMLAKDTIIQLTIYPNTPVGYMNWYGTDLDVLIQAASKWLAS